MTRRPVIAIDGPVGAGKSTIGRRLADRLDFVCLDSGQFYRAAAWAVIRSGTSPADVAAVVAAIGTLDLHFAPDPGGAQAARVLDGAQDITSALYAPAVERLVSRVSQIPEVRAALLDRQRAVIARGAIVVLGRDIGTVVWPQADLKIYLDADLDVRVERKWRQRKSQGESAGRADVRAMLIGRDELDAGRAIAPLRAAADAIRLATDDLSESEVVARIEALLRERSLVGAN